ncbi:MAG: prepilin-type N-terminal cleavage/methylation domain-containing protein [Candidatus Omnitrophica bacterium]|nr:prepilin-type N-terminal cleavage/methylation domain-containing protein [Candidatus Omnitrophota bacterium]
MLASFRTSFFKRGKGFTLIELLIVIAIILILIAIALPNFLEAQERARVARGKGHLRTMETGVNAYLTQYGYLYADYNDPFTVTRITRNHNSPSLVSPCPINPPIIRSQGGLKFPDTGFQQNFYSPGLHCPLTSPIKFIDAESTVDPWSDSSVPVGMDSRYISPGGGDNPRGIIYSAYFVSGPDKIAGDWVRGNGPDINGDGCPDGLPYSPTNGTWSRGEFWFVMGDWAYKAPFAGPCETAQKEYGGIRRTF